MSNGTGNIPRCACGGHPQPCTSYETLNSCGCCVLAPVGPVGQCTLCGGHIPPCGPGETSNVCGCCSPGAIQPTCPPYDTAVFGGSCPQGTVPDPRNPGCCTFTQCGICGGHVPPCLASETSNPCGCCSPGAPGASSSPCPPYETPGFPDPQSFGGVFCPAGTMADPSYPGCCAVTPVSPSPSPVPSPIPSPGPYLPPGYGSYPGSPYSPSPYAPYGGSPYSPYRPGYPGAYGTGGSLSGFGPAAGGVLCQLLASTGAGTTWLSELCALSSVVLPILGYLL